MEGHHNDLQFAELMKYLSPPEKLVAEEVDLLDDRIWIPDAELAYRMCNTVESRGDKVVVGFRDDQGFYEKKTIDKKLTQKTSLSHFCADMCNLTELNEASVLHTIRRRFDQKLIHTYSGLFCVVVNPWMYLPPLYSKDMIRFYSEQSKVHQIMPPHVYAVAQTAYDGILQGGTNQSILITGESGAGKTENTKRIIEYLICASDPSFLESQKGSSRSIDTAIINSGIAMEAFSNAKTIHNNNSSRIGKFIKIDFDHEGKLMSAKIECYLLEKSRVVNQNKGDRNFHIFYQLLSDGFPETLKSTLGLNKDAAGYKILNHGGVCFDKNIDDATVAKETDNALNHLGFTANEKRWVAECVAICILLGEIKFGERSGMDLSFVEGMAEVDHVTKLLCVKSSKLVDALTQPTIKVGDKLIRKNQNLKKTLFSVAALQKVIYERMFKWIVEKCNQAIDRRHNLNDTIYSHFIGVLDIAGFEIMTRNSFEQFCINYTNEKLQQFFNHFMFVKEQAEYMTERIEWSHVDYADDLQPTIDLVEKPMGLLAYLQEECIVPNGSDDSLLSKLVQNLTGSVFQKSKQSTRNTSVAHFVVQHYAGPVSYNIEGWVEKNRDVVDQCLLNLLSESSHALINKLFSHPHVEENSKGRRGSLAVFTVTHVYKEQLQDLLQTLNSTTANFVRCIVSNYERQPFKLDGPLVLHQLKCNGVLEGIRICRRGFPNRFTFDDFLYRYKILGGNALAQEEFSSKKSKVAKLFELLEVDREKYQLGIAKVFCRVGVVSELEEMRREQINALIVGVQAVIRWHYQQRVYREKQLEQRAISTIQSNTRIFALIATWPWFKLWLTVREIIPMNRNKDKMIKLEAKNKDLQEQYEQLQEERKEWEEEQAEYEEEIEELKQQHQEEIEKAKFLRKEVKRNEDLLDLMEKKFDEQHAKIMRLHTVQKENESKLQAFDAEKQALEKQLQQLREKYHHEKTLRENFEEELDEARRHADEAELKYQQMKEQYDKAMENADENEKSIKTWREMTERQSQNITELQKQIADLNEKVGSFDATLFKERSAKRKLENDIDALEEQIANHADDLEKAEAKREVMKEQLRQKDIQIKKLEKKLEDKTDEMEVCITELKKMHKTTTTEMQTTIDDLKRKCKKLEGENQQQKTKIEEHREASLEYESRPTSRMNYGGSLSRSQYSSNSLTSSFLSMSSSSIRTLGGCRSTTDYGSTMGTRSPYELTRDSSRSLVRSPSYLRMTRSVTQVEDCNLYRSPSTSQLHEKERKIAELERKLQTENTNYQILKREVDVYKTQLQEIEREKEQLSKQLRTANDSLNDTERQLKNEQRRLQTLDQSVTKLTRDVEYWKVKHEEAVNESKNDIIAERKKHQDKINALIHEYDLKLQHAQTHAKSDGKLHTDLIEAQAQLDRALSQITQMEKMSKSQFNIGETWEQQYRTALGEMDDLRDENAALKTRIRRQNRQIELLTQQSEMDESVSALENQVDKFHEKIMETSIAETLCEED